MKRLFWLVRNFFILNRRYREERNLIRDYCSAKKMLGLSNPNDSDKLVKLLRIGIVGKEAMLRGLLIESTFHNNELAVTNRELAIEAKLSAVEIRKDARNVVITWRDIAKVAVKFDLWSVQNNAQNSSIMHPNRAVEYTDIPNTDGTDIY